MTHNEVVHLVLAEIQLLVLKPSEPHHVFEFEHWGHYNKALHIVALVLRFCHNLKSAVGDRQSGDLSQLELAWAKTVMLKEAQDEAYHSEIEALKIGQKLPKGTSLGCLDPVLDGEGVLRMNHRLQFSDLSYESKHPVILPKGHCSLLLVRFQHDLLHHAKVPILLTSLRTTYWIVGLEQIAKRVCKECVPCRIVDARACNETMAHLPGFRVKTAPCFSITGMDHGGPLFCIDFPGKKFYFLLFTCAVVRALHVELTDSLNLPDCILAIRRFASRRGLPVQFLIMHRHFQELRHCCSAILVPIAPSLSPLSHGPHGGEAGGSDLLVQ